MRKIDAYKKHNVLMNLHSITCKIKGGTSCSFFTERKKERVFVLGLFVLWALKIKFGKDGD